MSFCPGRHTLFPFFEKSIELAAKASKKHAKINKKITICTVSSEIGRDIIFSRITTQTPHGRKEFIHTHVEIEIDESTYPETKFILNRNPADNSLLEKVQCTHEFELNEKIDILQQNQEQYWSQISLSRRINILRQAFQNAFDSQDNSAQKDYKTELAQLISTEMGKPFHESKDEVTSILQMKDDTLDMIHKANQPIQLSSSKIEISGFDAEVTSALQIRDPLGVIAVLSPWNFPAGELLLHVLPALAAGNAVLIKPSELTPMTGQYIVDRLKEYKFPTDTAVSANDESSTKTPISLTVPIDIVHGDQEIGKNIVEHPNIHSISMTGSSTTGKEILRRSSFPQNIKRLILELGGKDPMIVFEDADLELAAKDAVIGSTYNAGQVCCSIERIYVDKKIKEEFETLCLKECQKIVPGPWMDKQSTMGPLVSPLQLNRVKKQVETAVEQGAKILYQSNILQSKDPNKSSDPTTENAMINGNFYPATVLTNLNQSMTISHNETFGPVIAIYEFDGTEKTAIQFANDSQYGLSASVYTKNIKKATRVASFIRAGQVSINAWIMGGQIDTPLEW